MNHAINQWTAIDLFCGAGGLSEGFRQAGFHILVGNDANEAAAQTFQAAHRATQFLDGPIEHLPARRFLKASQLAKGQLDCLIGGPPCQAYSVYNHQRGLHDKRSLLFNDYLRIVNGLMPGWVVLENVTGILSIGEGKVVNDIMHQLRKLGYHVEYRILKAEEYGVPQERRRVVFLGNRWGIPISWPEVTHSDVHNTTMHPIVTVKDALYDLPILRNGEAAPNAAYRTSPKSAYQKMLRGHTPYVLNHAAPRLAPINLERMRHIPPGGSWRDVPVHLLPRGMQKARRCDHTKRYGRLAWHGLASTILTKCDLHWGAFIHPNQDRSLTVREAARLQSFPDSFEFHGSRTEQYTQVGNAMPPLLSCQIAKCIQQATQAFSGNSSKKTTKTTAVA